MAWFVKTETFTAEAVALPVEQRRIVIQQHREWIARESASGRCVVSGFLVDHDRQPGDGGLLLFEATSFTDALRWVESDPMIRSGFVVWKLSEWIVSRKI